MKTNLIFKYLTNTWSFVTFLSVFAVTFSFAILLRFGLTKFITKDFVKMNQINAEQNDEIWKAENLEKTYFKIYESKIDCFKNLGKNCNDYLVKQFCGDVSWVFIRDKCYKIFEEKKTWKDATRSCLALNATLIEIRKEYLKKFLHSLDLNITEGIYFISLKQTNPKNSWFWNFDKKSENFSAEPKCTELIVSNNRQYFGKFNNFRCDMSEQKFICQKKIENYHEKMQDYLYFSLLKLLKELEKLTSDVTFFYLNNAQDYLKTIIEKILKFNESNFEAYGIKFNILNNILNGASGFFKNKPNISVSLVYAFDELVKQISTKYSNPFNFSCSNFMITINDYPFVNHNKSNDLNYFPITQEFYKIYEIHEINELSILSKIKPKNSIRIKNKQSMFPGEFNSILDSLKTRISIIYFKNSKLFQSEQYFLSSPIINVMFFVISNMTSTFISNQIEYQTNFKKNKSIDQTSIKCVNWNVQDGKGEWTDRNCRFLKHDPLGNTHKCSCNQSNIVGLAYNFAIDNHLNKIETFLNLKTLNNIGLMFSSVCLLATLFLNLNIGEIKKSIELKITVTLASNLFICNTLFFLISIITPSINRSFCLAFGALLHYFLLSSFMFFLANSMIQFSAFINSVEDRIKNSYHKLKFFAFVVPALIPFVVLCTDHTLYINQNRSICWLNGMSLYITFIIPTAFITFLNFGLLFSMIYIFYKQREEASIVSRRKKITISFISFILKTQTWLIGLYLLFEYELDVFSEVSFCISNTFLGFFIFISYVYLTKPQSCVWHIFYDDKQSINKLERNFVTNNKLSLRPMIKMWNNSISERLSDSHNYEELMNLSNYKLNGSLENTSGYNSKPNSYSTTFFEDDVALRIEKLNQSLIRIKALNQQISIKNGTDNLNLTELPPLYFD